MTECYTQKSDVFGQAIDIKPWGSAPKDRPSDEKYHQAYQGREVNYFTSLESIGRVI